MASSPFVEDERPRENRGFAPGKTTTLGAVATPPRPWTPRRIAVRSARSRSGAVVRLVRSIAACRPPSRWRACRSPARRSRRDDWGAFRAQRVTRASTSKPSPASRRSSSSTAAVLLRRWTQTSDRRTLVTVACRLDLSAPLEDEPRTAAHMDARRAPPPPALCAGPDEGSARARRVQARAPPARRAHPA